MMFRQSPTAEQMQRYFPAMFATSEKETLSDKYLYIPTYKLVAGLESQGFRVVGAKQSGARTATREHAKHVIYLAHGEVKALSNVGEELPLLALTNSHNGLSSFAIDTAFFRLVCSNGLMLPTSAMSSARITHKIGMEQDVIEAASRVVSAFPEQIRMIEEMKRIELNRDEQRVLAESATRIAFETEAIELNAKLGQEIAPKLLRARRMADANGDLWSTFNVVQENVIKGGVGIVVENERGQRSMRRTRAVGAIDRDAKLNKELMTLAQEMMRIKLGA